MSDIAINPVTRRVQFVGNTGTGPYAFNFNILQASDIVVYKNNVLLVETTDYTVSIAANGTGNITLVVALVTTDILTMLGGRELSRTTDFVTAGDLLASSLNEQLDSNVIMSQQLDERFDRTIKAQPGDADANLNIPLLESRANKVLIFDTEGNVTTESASDLFGGNVLGGNYIVNTATGDGLNVTFGVTSPPGVKTNIQIYIDGVYQNKSTFSISGQSVIFSEAPPLNSSIEFMIGEAVTQITGDASAITYNQGSIAAQDRTVRSKLQEIVSVKDFGAVGDGVTDDYAAFELARTYCNDNDINSLLIPPASYHLSEPWAVPQGGNYVPCRTIANGAVLDNTVIAQNGAGIAGMTVDGSPDAGFVFTRGQGAYHEYLLAKNNGSYGFYWGVSSRQHLTVANSSGFQVGETVTGGTSSSDGVIERIDGNVLRLVKCNIASSADFFEAAETVTGGTSGASSTVSSIAMPYGSNYQVTRSTFSQLLSVGNANKGYYWDGTATANRSWFNANTVISAGGVANGGKGWVVRSYTAPGGGSQHNYNTFLNLNMESNADKSLSDTTGRQNTYLGGHFVDVDGAGESVAITDSYNFVLGGRYIGNINLSGTLFASVNKATGASFGRINGMDEITGLGDLDVLNEPLFYKGWSILPVSKQTFTVAGDNQNNHTLAIDMSDFVTANYVNMRVFIGGYRNQSGGYNDMDHTQLTLTMCSQAGGATTHAVSHAVASTEGISIDSVAISTAGVITITFDTANLIFTTRNIVEFYGSNDVDPRS